MGLRVKAYPQSATICKYVEVEVEVELTEQEVVELFNKVRKESNESFVPRREMMDTLDRSAQELRKVGQVGLAFRLDEIRNMWR